MKREEKPVQVSVVYDNVSRTPQMIAKWGFSCYVEGFEKSILFDTGGDGEVLIRNFKEQGIELEDVEIIFLSHFHWDHAGGIEAFLSVNSDVEVVIPRSCPDEFKTEIESTGARCREAADSFAICRNVYSTGELAGSVREQSLVLETEPGLAIITGCAHPGVVEILRSVKARFPGDIYMVIGGFHLLDRAEDEVGAIINQIRDLGVKKIAPGHCTGDRALGLFENAYGEDFVALGAGTRVSIV